MKEPTTADFDWMNTPPAEMNDWHRRDSGEQIERLIHAVNCVTERITSLVLIAEAIRRRDAQDF